MRLYLGRAAPVSQGRLFHLSQMNHLTSLQSKPVGAPKTNIAASPRHFISFLLIFFPFLFIPRKKQMSWWMERGLALDNRINFLPVKRRKRVSTRTLYLVWGRAPWKGFHFITMGPFTALNSSQLINTVTGTLHLWRHFFFFCSDGVFSGFWDKLDKVVSLLKTHSLIV